MDKSSDARLPTYAYFWVCNKHGSYRRCQSNEEVKNFKDGSPRKKSTIYKGGRKFFVSTVFLGIDHNFETTDGSDPILFETMVFDNTDAKTMYRDLYQDRYRTWEQAKIGHRKAVEYVNKNWPRLIPVASHDEE